MRKLLAITCAVLAACAAAAATAHDFGQRNAGSAVEARTIEAPLGSEPEGSPAQPVLYSMIARKLTWPPGQLGVCFWNGPESLRRRIATIADELVAGRPISFVWQANGATVTCPLDGYQAYPIRVSLQPDQELVATQDNPSDYFATIGRAVLIDTRKANVNLPFPANPPEALLRNRTLHEFCHSIGCLHEHQRGACGFDKEAIMANNPALTEELYENNFERIPSTNAYYQPALVGDLDRDSIMMYTFFKYMLVDPAHSPCYREADVTRLSPRDEAGLAAAYPPPTPYIPVQLADFARYESYFAAQASASRSLADTLRTKTMGWAMTSPAAASAAERPALQASILERAAKAEAEASQADQLAESYRLLPETKRRLEAALALMPKD